MTTTTKVGRGIRIGEDLSKWQYWWEFNKDQYLSLKDSLRTNATQLGSDEFYMGSNARTRGRLAVRPSVKDIEQRIVPALHAALAKTQQRDIVSGCLVALAKIGREPGAYELLPAFRQHLAAKDQEIRETAALAMGISQKQAALVDLLSLARDGQGGRRLTGRARVDARTRSFAVYGLGLIASAHRDGKCRLQVLRAVKAILSDHAIVDRNVKVAAINTLGLLSSRDEDDGTARLVTKAAVRALLAFYAEDASIGRDVVRAHVPTAVARLVGRGLGGSATGLKNLCATELRGAERSGLIVRSAALALGQVAVAAERHKPDAVYSRVLQRYFQGGKDGQARYFALVALARIGGEANRVYLLDVLRTGKRELERPWAGLALGCLSREMQRAGSPADERIGKALHAAFRAARTPYARGALAVGLGLARYQAAAADLIEQLESRAHQDEMSGYVCVGLAMMGYQPALDPIIDVLDGSVRRPHRMRMAAVALGKLGDRRLTQRLTRLMHAGEPSLARLAAVATTLAQIGDRATIDPLCDMLANEDLPAISRAFAAVALGGMADKEALPWNAKFAVNINYRAAVETLVESGAGILEIL